MLNKNNKIDTILRENEVLTARVTELETDKKLYIEQIKMLKNLPKGKNKT